ncbi:hypothetical protein XANCAGTX0491_007256 [Xanthoria calcicola]
MNGTRIQDFMDYRIEYGGFDTLDYMEVSECEGVEIFFLRIDKATEDQKPHYYINLSQEAFIELLEATAIPPSFVEALVYNNGAFTAYERRPKAAQPPELLKVLIKLPNAPGIWSTICLRHDLGTQRTTCLIVGTHAIWIQALLQQIYRHLEANEDPWNPYIILSAIGAEISAIYEEDRCALDFEVRGEEIKTGVSPLNTDPNQRLGNFDWGSTRHLHRIAGQFHFRERASDFQIRLISFLIGEQTKFTIWRKANLPESGSVVANDAADRIRHSLHLALSFTVQRHKQITELIYRIEAQVRVVDNMIAQGDSRVAIANAEQSHNITFDTRRDSIAMKIIAALTMAFLPGTFVATIFGMVFFQPKMDHDAGIDASPDLWIYAAVTAPLTVIVFVIGVTWLKQATPRKTSEPALSDSSARSESYH